MRRIAILLHKNAQFNEFTDFSYMPTTNRFGSRFLTVPARMNAAAETSSSIISQRSGDDDAVVEIPDWTGLQPLVCPDPPPLIQLLFSGQATLIFPPSGQSLSAEGTHVGDNTSLKLLT
jgi:hypothetical protein